MAVDADVPSPRAPAGATSPAPATGRSEVAVPTRTHRVRSWLLLAFAAWNVWVWGTRAINMVGERTEWTVGFVVVHLLLFGGGLAAAVVLGVVGWRMRREARAADAGA